mmetsp:Transcript_2399/g.5103  ORF Transcript_2399/g.5103 Transcript_2399/m.5103 type:complete len:319 (+) Transcript_2399:123-1079(+)
MQLDIIGFEEVSGFVIFVFVCWLATALVTVEHVMMLFLCAPSRRRSYYVFLSAVPLLVATECMLTSLRPRWFPLWEWVMRFLEAQALNIFGKLIILFAGGREALLERLAVKPAQKYFAAPPACFLSRCVPTAPFTGYSLRICKALIKQFMYVVPALSVLHGLLFLSYDGLHGGRVPRKEVFLIMNLSGASVGLCVYGLVVIYHAVHEELHSARVIEKFISMKLIIILSTFQSNIIDGLRASGILYGDASSKTTEWALSIMKSVLLAAECPLMALMTAWAFAGKELPRRSDSIAAQALLDEDNIASVSVGVRRRLASLW